MTLEQMAREFHEAAGLTLPPGPTLNIGAQFVSDEVRQKILDEEVQELRDAVAAGDLVQIADALADIAYVVAGTAVTYGLPFDAIMAEVHRSNMSKFGPDGPKVRGDGKIIKGPGYEPPQIAALIVSGIELECPSCNTGDPDDYRGGCEDPWHEEARLAPEFGGSGA